MCKNYYTILYYAMLCYAMPCHAMPYYTMWENILNLWKIQNENWANVKTFTVLGWYAKHKIYVLLIS